jgi:hypothetical protein
MRASVKSEDRAVPALRANRKLDKGRLILEKSANMEDIGSFFLVHPDRRTGSSI